MLLLLGNGKLNKRLTNEHRGRPAGEQSLVLKLEPQLLLLGLQNLNLLVEVIMEQVLSMLCLQRELRRAHSSVGIAEVVGLVRGIRRSTTR